MGAGSVGRKCKLLPFTEAIYTVKDQNYTCLTEGDYVHTAHTIVKSYTKQTGSLQINV